MSTDSRDSGAQPGSFIRPDPVRGQLGDIGYARHWEHTHQMVVDPVAYRAGYVDLLVLDSLLPDGYRLLDVGCGTAGYHRLLRRHGLIHGIDPIPEMIEAANRFKDGFGITHATYSCTAFETFDPIERFDAVRLVGTFGWYTSWYGQQHILYKVSKILNNDGIAIVSHVPPANILMTIKAAVALGRTIIFPEKRLQNMASKAGLSAMFVIRYPHANILLLRKTGID